MQGRLVDTLGHRAKIGLLVPGANTVVQPECDSLRPRGVTNHVARLPLMSVPPSDTEAYREASRQRTESALDAVMLCEPSIVVLGHSIDSFSEGSAGANRLHERLAKRAGVDVVIPSLALLDALAALDAGRRIAILTPYSPARDSVTERFFRDAGYEVMGVKGLDCRPEKTSAAVPVATIMACLRELSAGGADAIIQAGTNLPMADIAGEAERWLGKPVLAINTAIYWNALRKIGITDALDGFGTLAEQH